MWTAPHRLLVVPMDDDAARAIGAAAARRSEDLGLPLPGVVGDVRAAERAADGVGRPWSATMSERLLVLHDYLPPASVIAARVAHAHRTTS